MDRFLKTVGIFALLYLVYLGSDYLIEQHRAVAATVLQVIGGVAVVVAIVAGGLRLWYGKGWLLKAGTHFYFGAGLINATEKLIQESKSGKITERTTAEVLSHLLWRLTRIGLFAALVTSIPLILLWQQNRLISFQNTRIDTQTILDSVQTILTEQQVALLTSQDSSFKK